MSVVWMSFRSSFDQREEGKERTTDRILLVKEEKVVLEDDPLLLPAKVKGWKEKGDQITSCHVRHHQSEIEREGFRPLRTWSLPRKQW